VNAQLAGWGTPGSVGPGGGKGGKPGPGVGGQDRAVLPVAIPVAVEKERLDRAPERPAVWNSGS